VEKEKGRRGEGEKGRRGEEEKRCALPVSPSPLLPFNLPLSDP